MKGQWFLISAVMATGVFLAVSGLFKSYSLFDTSEVARGSESLYFSSVREAFSRIVSSSPSCAAADPQLREFRSIAEGSAASLGMFMFLNYTDTCRLGLMIASSRMVICENVDMIRLFPGMPDISCKS